MQVKDDIKEYISANIFKFMRMLCNYLNAIAVKSMGQ